MQNEPFTRHFRAAAVALLVLLFVYAAAAKLFDLRLFHAQLYNQSFPHKLADVLYYAIPVTELVTAGLLLFRATQRTGLWLSLWLLSAFTGYTVLVLAGWWKKVPCSCGGILSGMSWGGRLVFNIIFLCLNLIILYLTPGRKAG